MRTTYAVILRCMLCAVAILLAGCSFDAQWQTAVRVPVRHDPQCTLCGAWEGEWGNSPSEGVFKRFGCARLIISDRSPYDARRQLAPDLYLVKLQWDGTIGPLTTIAHSDEFILAKTEDYNGETILRGYGSVPSLGDEETVCEIYCCADRARLTLVYLCAGGGLPREASWITRSSRVK
jgi:hypothetical protein